MADVLVSSLSWGLGHATRDIPLIREFLSRGHRVTFLADGPALTLLRKEFPACDVIQLPDYPVPFGTTRFFMMRFALGVPGVLSAIRAERFAVRETLRRRKFALIVSDARFHVCAPDTPSYFISHQLRYCMPSATRWFEPVTYGWNQTFFKRFNGVLVPDNPPGPMHLTGRLSEVSVPGGREPTRFVGILASVARARVPEDIDWLISISGPGPQRAELERILLPQIPGLPGKKVVLLGKPAEDVRRQPDADTDIRSHASREEMAGLMSRAKFIVSRSGYTTMMELAEMGKKRALLIPTPGQTEQEHLSDVYEKNGWFHSVSQYRVNLAKDVERAAGFNGFPAMPRTAENVRRLFDEVFSRHLG